jgi:hypothetical protein
MSTHQCPKCELRFERKTELDDHCWHDHPQFRHDYPAVAVTPEPDAAPPPAPAADTTHEPTHFVDGLGGWLTPARPHD